MRQVELTERIVVLRQVPTLAGLSSADLTLLARTLRARSFEEGETLLREEDPPSQFLLIRAGEVSMLRKGNKYGHVRGPGAVGLLPFLARQEGTTAFAVTPVEAYEVRGEAFEELLDDHFSVLFGTVGWVVDRYLGEMLEQTPAPYEPPAAAALYDLVGNHEIGVVERIFLLRRTRAFSGVNVNSVATIARQMEEVRAPKGEVLWSPGDRAEGSYLVVKGTLELRWKGGAAVQTVGPGYTVGGAEALVQKPRWNQLVATSPAVLLRGRRDAIVDAFEDDVDLALGFTSMLATMLLAVWDRKAAAGVLSVGGGPPAPRSLPGPTRAAAP